MLTIALDGPVAAGKTSVGRALAERLGYRFLDTGAIYRALTYAALDQGVPVKDGLALGQLARDCSIEVKPAADAATVGYRVLVDGCDVTPLLRSASVDGNVSAVSAHPEVRGALITAQRAAAEGGGMVMVGRDIGTVVLPDADLKIFLTASVEERARRRFRERIAAGDPAQWADVHAATAERDARDMGRAEAPLSRAGDAVEIDTDGQSFEAVVERLVLLARAAELDRGAPSADGESGTRAP